MPYIQRDLVYLKNPIKMPTGEDLPHPVLIISSNRANSYENYYTGVMMSATEHVDRFSFPLSDDMFESPLDKSNCCIRTYITLGFREADIKNFKNRMKMPHFKILLEQIKTSIFAVDL